MSKLQIISDKNKKSSNIKKLLLKKIKSNKFKKENQILEDNLNLVFEAHSKSKQKKLSEQFK